VTAGTAVTVKKTTDVTDDEILQADGIALGTPFLDRGGADASGFGTLGTQAPRQFGERFARLTRQIRASRERL
jgi:hypothetical protein